MNFEEFMKLIKYDVVMMNKLIQRATNNAFPKMYNCKVKSFRYQLGQTNVYVNVTTTLGHENVPPFEFPYDDLYEIVTDNIDELEFSHLRSVTETKVVYLEKSDVAAMARMFNGGADVVKVQVTPTGIGNKVEVTPFTDGVEGETADVTDYSKW